MTTITIHADDRLHRELEERAASSGKSLSAVAGEILRQVLTPRRMGDRVGHLAGSLEASGPGDDSWRRDLRERNWRS
jgi:plasmid stability protein